MAIDERLWGIMGKRLGYSEEELEEFQADPRNALVLEKAAELAGSRIVLEVVESHGCNSRHSVGDRIVFDGAGNLLTDQSPKKICAYALPNALLMICAANEMIYQGLDGNDVRFRRTQCFDVGPKCGGWGRIVLEMHVERKRE
jgi:uncharacterized repeat protein (TIGR04076 family)